jgi:hypothetical protein
MIVWGGSPGGPFPIFDFNTGGQYDPVGNTWTATTTTGAPSARKGHTAVWNGKRMIVWGGTELDTGGEYDPIGGSWRVTRTLGAPSGRADHTAVWTGKRMIVWGGHGPGGIVVNTGGQHYRLNLFCRS